MGLKIMLLLCTSLTVGCTTTPDQFKNNSSVFGQASGVSMQANNSKMQALATGQIGVAQQYVDRDSGMTASLVVESEYFSASGRNCRRFQENVNGRASTGVGCEDTRNGWVELPLATVLR